MTANVTFSGVKLIVEGRKNTLIAQNIWIRTVDLTYHEKLDNRNVVEIKDKP